MQFLWWGQDHESTRRRNERDLRVAYFGHVVADLYRLGANERKAVLDDLPHALQKLLVKMCDEGELTRAEESMLDWSEVAMLEDQILAHQDDETVRRRAWVIRARYQRLAGADRFAAYLASGPPDEKDAAVPMALVRADLRRLLELTHLSYSLASVGEKNRRRAMFKVLYWTLGVCFAAGLLGFANLPVTWLHIGTLVATVFFGCLGAYISVQRRLQDSTDAGDPVIGILGVHAFNSIQPFPLIAGGIFAVVLYVCFVGKLLTGDLFPVVSATGVPATIDQWAKLFVWSLVSGFAERLVPDTLDRFANQAQPKAGTSTVVVNRTVTATAAPPQPQPVV